jgi:hypothetical protein
MTRSKIAGLLEKITRIIPGIAGYQDREKRRDSDKIVRENASLTVASCRDRLSRVMADLSRAGGMNNLRIVGDLERLCGRLERLEDEIRYAAYGYASWFDSTGIELDDLERMYEFDLGLLDAATMMESIVPQQLGGDGAWVRDLGIAIDELKRSFDDRKKVFEGL